MKNFKEFGKLYEFEENSKLPVAGQAFFMDNLYKRVKEEIMPTIPSQFKLDYKRGREISIHTSNKKDLHVGAKVGDDKMTLYSSPVGEPDFDLNYNFNYSNADSIIDTMKGEFEKSETSGLSKDTLESSKEPIARDLKDFRRGDVDINIPITDKPRRIKRSIEIKIIKNVLEDAFILDDIELKNVKIDELIRRMLLESRKKKT